MKGQVRGAEARPARVPVLLGLLLASFGCEAPAEAPTQPAPERAPTADDQPRAPRGAQSERCEGRSVDPPELDEAEAWARADLQAAISRLEALVGAHSGSATARVRLGELLLRTSPPRAREAMTWFDRAIALHDNEHCELTDGDFWATLEGAGLSRMMQGNYAASVPFFERSLTAFGPMRSTNYNLACARCQVGDVDRCAQALEHVFTDRPSAPLREERDLDHYQELARRDPDLAPLRSDAPRFEAILAR